MAQGVEYELDYSELAEAIEQYIEATKKDLSEVVNKAAKAAAFAAVSEAPKTTKSKMKKHEPRERARYTDHNTLFHALATEGNKFGKAKRGQGNRALAQRTYNSRTRAIGYSKSLWLAIARDLGASIRASITHKDSGARPATPLNPEAVMEVKETSGSRSASNLESYRDEHRRALQRGLNAASIKLKMWAAEKLQKRSAQFSG